MKPAEGADVRTARQLPTFRLDGAVALVSGAGGGIGARIAQGLAEFGADVACLDLAGERLERAVEGVRGTGRAGIGIATDITDPEAVERAVQQVERDLGPLRLAVNGAGVHSNAPSEEMDRATWQRLVDVNLTGVFHCCQAEARAMIRNGGGSILNIGSISASIANRGLQQAHYNATKAAVVQLSRSLALEWADHGVRVNTLSPGYVRTSMARSVITTRPPADFLDDIPLRRMAEPVEMVGPAVFLLSDAASYCTGSELIVDGGTTGW